MDDDLNKLTAEDAQYATKTLLESSVQQALITDQITEAVVSKIPHMEIRDLINFHKTLSSNNTANLRTLVGSQALVAAASQQHTLRSVDPSVGAKYEQIESKIGVLERGSPEQKSEAKDTIQGLGLLSMLIQQVREEIVNEEGS